MHPSTWVVLLFLMAGEIVILAIGGFVLWLVGEFGDVPKWMSRAFCAWAAGRNSAESRQRAVRFWRIVIASPSPGKARFDSVVRPSVRSTGTTGHEREEAAAGRPFLAALRVEPYAKRRRGDLCS